MGAEQLVTASRVHRLRREGDTAYILTHADDNLIVCQQQPTADYILAKFGERYTKYTHEYTPTLYKGYSLAWDRAVGAVTVRCTQRVVDMASRYFPESLLEQHDLSCVPGAAVSLVAAIRSFVRPEPLPPLTRAQKTAQRWIGELKYMDNVLVQLKFFIHALTRHMCYPPPESIALLRELTRAALSFAGVGVTFSAGSTSALDLEASISRAEDIPAPDIICGMPPAVLQASYDASWQSPPVKSVQAFAVQVFGGAVSVGVTCIPTVMASSFNAELYAACIVATKIVWLREALSELGITLRFPTCVFGDNRAVQCMAKPGAVPTKCKADARRVGLMQEYTCAGAIVARKVDTKHNPVDFLTKLVDAKKFARSAAYLTNAARAVQPAVSFDQMLDVAISLIM